MRPIIPILAVGALLVLTACPTLNPGPGGPDCATAQVDDRGNLIVAAGTDTATAEVSESGGLQAQHPGLDTSTDEWYGTGLALDCPTLGGAEPPSDVKNDGLAVQDSTAAALVDSLGPTLLALPPSPAVAGLPAVKLIRLDSLCGGVPCAGMLPAGSPFHGADIIYVHGLITQPMLEVVGGAQKPRWPADAADFLSPGGYWRQQAQGYWTTHVSALLTPRGAKNRVLFVGWSPLQRVEIAAHTVLAQISDAMQTGNGVVLRDPNDPRQKAGFCQPSCVVISHSAGALVTDVAMSLAAHAGLAPVAVAPAFGGLGWIPAHMRVHVALGGTFSGSPYATAAVALAAGQGPPATLCRAAMSLLGNGACPNNLTPLLNSVLRDLIPAAAQGAWGPVLVQTPVPVLTIAGGNHDAQFPLKRYFGPGFDDGAVNMDSGCGRATPFLAWPAGYVPYSWPRVYDKGIANHRAYRFFSEQRFEPMWSSTPGPRASAACSPWKSPTGMVQPVLAFPALSPLSPLAYYPRHHPFIQTTETHVDGLLDCQERPAEDVLAIANHLAYSLVGTGISNLQDENVRGRKWPKKKPKLWIWKRTYHQLHDWEVRCAADYAYDWVL